MRLPALPVKPRSTSLLPTALLTLLLLLWSGGVAGAASYQRTDGTIVDPILYETPGGERTIHPYVGPDLEPGVVAQFAQLAWSDLTGADLAGADLTGASLEGAVLDDVDLSGAVLVSASFECCNLLRRADFSGADMRNSFLGIPLLTGAKFDGADLRGVLLGYNDPNNFDSVSFRQANLSGVAFNPIWHDGRTVSASGADFSGANLSGAFHLGDLTGSPFYDENTDFTAAWADGAGPSAWGYAFVGSVPFDPVAAGWTLVPEPNSALLLGIGLSVLVARRKNR